MPSIPCHIHVKSLRSQTRSAKKSKIKPFINKYNWEATIHQKNTNGKNLRKTI